MEDYDKWGSCPSEILALVFKYLDAKDLLSCRGVNRSWRDNANYSGEKYKKWEQLLEKVQNKGFNSCQRTKLNFKDLYLNYCMWYSVKKAQVMLKHVYGLNQIKKIHVHKDTLVVVCADSVQFFNLETNTMSIEILEPCLDYLETDYLVAKITRKGLSDHLSLYSKRHNKTIEALGCGLYNVQQNKCHYMDSRNAINFYECTNQGLVLQRLGRYYSSPRLLKALYMYENDMFVYTGKGDVFHRKNGQLGIDRICTLDVPSSPGTTGATTGVFITTFHKCSAVYAVESKEKEGITSSYAFNKDEHLALLYYGLTCAVQHDGILLLGFQDGKVGMVIIKHLWITYNLTPVFQFYIHEVARVQQVEPVKALEVYEADGCHHVIVQTASNLYQVVISHADYNKVMT